MSRAPVDNPAAAAVSATSVPAPAPSDSTAILSALTHNLAATQLIGDVAAAPLAATSSFVQSSQEVKHRFLAFVNHVQTLNAGKLSADERELIIKYRRDALENFERGRRSVLSVKSLAGGLVHLNIAVAIFNRMGRNHVGTQAHHLWDEQLRESKEKLIADLQDTFQHILDEVTQSLQENSAILELGWRVVAIYTEKVRQIKESQEASSVASMLTAFIGSLTAASVTYAGVAGILSSIVAAPVALAAGGIAATQAISITIKPGASDALRAICGLAFSREIQSRWVTIRETSNNVLLALQSQRKMNRITINLGVPFWKMLKALDQLYADGARLMMSDEYEERLLDGLSQAMIEQQQSQLQQTLLLSVPVTVQPVADPANAVIDIHLEGDEAEDEEETPEEMERRLLQELKDGVARKLRAAAASMPSPAEEKE